MIYVITRTNNRPNKFKVCAESVAMQNIECTHITISENKLPDYVEATEGITSVVLNKSDFEHYNEYLDWALANMGVDGDYFAFLDDDDFYLWPNSLQTAMFIGNGHDLILWRVNASNNVIVPRINTFQAKEIKFGDVSGIGFLVRKGSFHSAKFGNKLGGDYNFLKDAIKECDKVKWINKVLSSTNPLFSYGAGNEQDAPIEKVREGFKTAQNHLKIWS